MRSIIVSRTELGLPDLQLWQAGKYILPEGTFGPGEAAFNRVTTEGPLFKGRHAVSIVEGQRTANLGVHVMADVIEDLQPRCKEVVDALTQFRYMLQWQWNGLGGVWQCETADWAPGEGGIINEGWLKHHNQPLYFTVPHRRVSGF